jgi:hypothetical protein
MVLVVRGRLVQVLCPILWAGLEACGSGSSTASVVASPGPAAPARAPRDPGLDAVRAAIEEGRGDQALVLLEGRQGFEPELLRARAELLSGTPVGALTALERARALDAEDPELYATEAEVLATLDRIQAAADVLTEGMRRAGPVPALFRAQGVIELRNQGHGEKALAALERALALDPELPFTRWPLAQAHLLVGRARLEKQPAEATRHARAARALWPDLGGTVHDDALELEAEGLGGELRFEEALALYAQLEARGRRYGDTPAILHQRCATRCLLEHDRARAIEHYLAARALGMDDEGLGFGAPLLAEEARHALERGLSAAEARDWAKARDEFARALELAPGDLEAGNHLAVARFQEADYRGAAEAWERVLAGALEAKLELPDPVPLNLAKAWRLAGERGRARKVLSDLLDRDPAGEWSDPARDLLFVLEAEELAGK